MYDAKTSSEHCSSERDYELMLKLAKDKYEQRLEAITDKVRLIYEEVRRDEVLATMREDPASNAFASQRVLEICEDNLALEREEAIERLLHETTNAQAQVKKLDRENAILRAALLAAEEKLSTERVRLTETHSLELQNKLAAITKEYETQIQSKIQHKDHETQQELADLRQNLSHTQAELKEKEYQIENLTAQFNKAKELHQQALANESNRQDEERAQLELEYSAKLDQLRAEVQNHQQTTALLAQEQQYKSKSSRLKKKIIEQKSTISKLQQEVDTARTALEQTKENYDKSLGHVQEDLTKVRDTWQMRCSELQREHSAKLTEIQNSHQNQLREMQVHYQRLLDEQLADYQTSAQIHQQIEQTHITKAKHQQILAEEISQVKSQHFKEIRESEETLANQMNERIRGLREEHREQIEQLNRKLDGVAQEKSEAILQKRQLENNLECSNQKIETLNTRLTSLNEDLAFLENSKRNLLQTVEDNSLQLAKFKGMYEEELFKKSRVEAELQTTQQKFNETQQLLTEKCQNFAETNTKLKDTIANLEQNLTHETKTNKQLKSDLESLHLTFEREKEDFSINFTEKLRSEEQAKLDQQAKSFQETQHLLKEAETQIATLAKDLHTVRSNYQKCKSDLASYQSEAAQLKEQLADQQNASSHGEGRYSDLQKKYTLTRQKINDLKYTARHAFQSSLAKLKTDLKTLSRRSLQELNSFKSSLVEELGEAITAMERTHSTSKHTQERQIQQKSQEIQRLTKMLQDSQDTLNLSIQEQGAYENNMKGLKETISSLKREIQSKKQEIQAFENNLDEFQGMRRSLEKENRRLQNQLKSTQDSFEQYKQESFELQAKASINEDSAREVTRLQTELKRQQNSHAKEVQTLTNELESVKELYHQKQWTEDRHYDDAATLKEELHSLELKASGIMDRLQNDLISLHESIADEKMKHQRYKAERKAEIETLREEVKGLHGDLQLKNDIIERFEQENQILRRQLRDPNCLQELKGKLAQSYHSTLETVKQAKALEKETHQLAAQARGDKFYKTNVENY